MNGTSKTASDYKPITFTFTNLIAVQTKIIFPPGVEFSDLRLCRDAAGRVTFEWRPIAAICEASGLELTLFSEGPEDNVASLMVHWYHQHLANGGARDAIQDELIAETIFEDHHGDGTSHMPGHA